MVSQDSIELLFNVLEETSNLISKALAVDIFTAIGYSVENIVTSEIIYTNDDITKRLVKLYGSIEEIHFEREEIRKAMQYLILKSLKNSQISNMAITPDFISFFMGYLMKKFVRDRHQFSILNPNMKSGNLILGILNSLKSEQIQVTAIEEEEVLIKLSKANFDMHQYDANLIFEDSLMSHVGLFDFIICDLPHTNYENQTYHSKFYDMGLRYYPYLFIEKYMNHLYQEGIMMLLIPNEFFEDDEYNFRQFINQNMKMLGLLKLPDDLFAGNQKKSILLLKDIDSKEFNTSDFLLIDLPSIKDNDAFKTVVNKIDQWFKQQYINFSVEGEII